MARQFSFNDIYTQAVQDYSVTVARLVKRKPLRASPNLVAIHKVTLYRSRFSKAQYDNKPHAVPSKRTPLWGAGNPCQRGTSCYKGPLPIAAICDGPSLGSMVAIPRGTGLWCLTLGVRAIWFERSSTRALKRSSAVGSHRKQVLLSADQFGHTQTSIHCTE